MKVLLITHDIGTTSGWGRYSKGVYEHLLRKEEHVEVIVEAAVPGKNAELRPVESIASILRNMLKARRAAASYDVVHALDVWPYALYGYAAVVGTGKKLFINGVGTYSVAPLASPGKRMLLALPMRRAKTIFCISTFVKDQMYRLMPLTTLRVVHLGYSPLPRLEHDEVELFRQKYALGEGAPIILTVGAIKPRKGQLDTAISLSTLLPRFPKLEYIIVGSIESKEYAEEIRAFAANVGMSRQIRIMTNVCDDKDLAFFYSTTDVFVMNSNNQGLHFEGFGQVFLEAAHFGKPVVGSSGCGIEDAMEDGYNGYLAEQGNHKDIAMKIGKALENRAELGSHSRDFVKDFSWDKTVEAYRAFYNATS